MSVTLTRVTYDALEDLASNLLDRALVLSRYAAGPMCVGYRPCLALVVDSVSELFQFTVAAQLSAAQLELDYRTAPPDDVPLESWYVARDLYAWLHAVQEGGAATFQHTWTDGQLVFYWPAVQVGS